MLIVYMHKVLTHIDKTDRASKETMTATVSSIASQESSVCCQFNLSNLQTREDNARMLDDLLYNDMKYFAVHKKMVF